MTLSSGSKKDSTTKAILSAMGMGTLFGLLVNHLGYAGAEISRGDGAPWLPVFVNDHIINGLFMLVSGIFIGGLKSLVVPLVFCALFLGVTSLADPKKLGALGGKALLIYLSTTAIAVTLAMGLATIIAPGEGLNMTATGDATYATQKTLTFWQTLAEFIPENPMKMMTEGNMIPLILFTVLFAVCYNKASTTGRFKDICQDADQTFMVLIGMIMKIAPYAVFCMLATVLANSGFKAISSVGLYFVTVVLALLLHFLITYNGLIIVLMARLNPVTFIKKSIDAAAFAFSTSSSAAATPVNIQTAEKKLGVENSTASFTIPLGATVNMDGTAIMQGVATLFIAQAFNIDLTLEQMALVVGTAVAASVGTAAVPGVGMVMLAMVLNQVNLPTEGIALIIGIDRLLDMMRTAVNTTGDLAATVYIAKTTDGFDESVYNDIDAGSGLEIGKTSS